MSQDLGDIKETLFFTLFSAHEFKIYNYFTVVTVSSTLLLRTLIHLIYLVGTDIYHKQNEKTVKGRIATY